MTDSTKQDNQEIDLEKVYLKFNSSVKKSLIKIYELYLFFKRNAIYLFIIFILCAAAGYFLDKKGNTYQSEIYLKSNIDNVDYLYNKIDAINSKILQRDTTFFLNNNIHVNDVVEIEIKPIEDPFNFVAGKDEKAFELLKLFAEENDITKVVSDKNFYKNYSNHNIIITSKSPIKFKEVHQSIIKYLNNNQYYEDFKIVIDKNTDEKIKANNLMISQIDDIIKNSNSQKDSTSSSIIMVGENSKLSDLLRMKEQLISENQKFNFIILNNTSIFKVVSVDIENIKHSKHLFIFVLPLLGVFLYLSIAFMRAILRLAKSYKTNEI